MIPTAWVGQDDERRFATGLLVLDVNRDEVVTSAEDEPNSYVSVPCLACTRLHFIHKETGKLLGED